MSKRSSVWTLIRSWQLTFPVMGLLLGMAGITKAEDLGSRPQSWEPRVLLGKSLSPAGSLLVNEQPGQPWQAVDEGAEIKSRDLLLALPGMSAKVETRGLELTLWGNLPELSSFAGLQSAVILHDSRAFDLDFTLYQGRLILTNKKESGAARVWMRIEGAAFQLTLGGPGDSICLALNSFWPRGVAFNPTPRAEDIPARSLQFVAVKGQVSLTADGTQHLLKAPPGPAQFRWDSVRGPAEGTQSRNTLPAWADPQSKTPAQAKAQLEAIDKYKGEVKDKDPRTALYGMLDSAKMATDKEQAHALAEVAVLGLSALSDMDRVLQALSDAQNAPARRAAVAALRHWIGDAAGRDQRLYQHLIDNHGYTKNQAATLLQLLHNALAPEEPDTYETLIAFLRHEKLAIRVLAWSQLSSLVPEDIALPYDPAASQAEREKAYKAWKELIPSGSLPKRKPKGNESGGSSQL